MTTPYQEISKNYSSREAVKTDANLSQDSMQLGGISAEEYVTKEFLRKYGINLKDENAEYTDEQIRRVIEDLKGYTDNAIGNINLEPYAKKTDLETVRKALIEHCKNSCATSLNTAKEYTNTEITKVNKNIENINGKYDELFQSVSNGKRKIAAAITDKGQNTSAADTFDTMASKIRDIETTIENGFNTADATITPDTVLKGFVGYGANGKVVGTHEVDPNLDTADATATSAQILAGYTAYARGQKIVGSFKPVTGNQPVVTGEQVEKLYKTSTNSIPAKTQIKHFNAVDTNEIEINDTYIIKSYDNNNKKIGVFIPYEEENGEFGEALVNSYSYIDLGLGNDTIDFIKLSKVSTTYGNGQNTKILFAVRQNRLLKHKLKISAFAFNTARVSSKHTGGEIITDKSSYPMEMETAYHIEDDVTWHLNSTCTNFSEDRRYVKAIAVPETISDRIAIVTGTFIDIYGLRKDSDGNISLGLIQNWKDDYITPAENKNVFAVYESQDRFLRISNANGLDKVFLLNDSGLIDREINYPSDIDTSIGRHIAITKNGKYCIINFVLYRFDNDYNLVRVHDGYCCSNVPCAYSWVSYDGQYLFTQEIDTINNSQLGKVTIQTITYNETDISRTIDSFDFPVKNNPTSGFSNIGHASIPMITQLNLYGVSSAGENRIYKCSYDNVNKELIGILYNGQTFYKEGAN